MRACILSRFSPKATKSKYLRIWSIWSIRIDLVVALRTSACRWVSMKAGIRSTQSKLPDLCHSGLVIESRPPEAQQTGSMKTPSACYQHWGALLAQACSFLLAGQSITTSQQTYLKKYQKTKNPTLVNNRQEKGSLNPLQIRKIPSLPSTRDARVNAMIHFLLWKKSGQGKKVRLLTQVSSKIYKRGILVEVIILDLEAHLVSISKSHWTIPWLSCQLPKSWYIALLMKWTLISSSKVRLLAETLRLTISRLSSSETTNRLNKRFQSTSYRLSKAQTLHFTSFRSLKKWSKPTNGQQHSPIFYKVAQRWTQASQRAKTPAVISKTSVCRDWTRSANKWLWVWSLRTLKKW